MAFAYDNLIVRVLVGWFGVYQLAHIVTNVLGVIDLARGSVPRFPVPPPEAGWDPQAVSFFLPLASADLLVAVLSVAFVAGYFQRKHWCQWLGAVTVSTAVFGHAVAGGAVLHSGAWNAHPGVYVPLALVFLPVVLLLALSVHTQASGSQ